ncbi:Kif3c, partial [Symbiodinium microadriaticum]
MRPFNTKEKNEKRSSIVEMDMELNQVSIGNPDHPEAPPKTFTFDSVYDGDTQQRAFYEESCFQLVENVLVGFNGTIFAYGQTGCGKTWTMQGPNNPPELRGVIPNAFSHIFDQVTASKDVEYLVRCSYLEIYNEVIRDLLGDQKNPNKCDLHEDPQKGIVVSNLTDVVVKTEAECDSMLNKGLANRT